jgi:hypothetical protein
MRQGNPLFIDVTWHPAGNRNMYFQLIFKFASVLLCLNAAPNPVPEKQYYAAPAPAHTKLDFCSKPKCLKFTKVATAA